MLEGQFAVLFMAETVRPRSIESVARRRTFYFSSKGAVGHFAEKQRFVSLFLSALYCFFLTPRIFFFLYRVLGKICFVCSQDGGRRVSALRPRGKSIGEDVGAAAVLSLGGVRPVADREASTSWLWGDILEWFYDGNMASGRRRMWECNGNDEKRKNSAQKVHL